MKILSFDIEEWFHILDNESTVDEHRWRKFTRRLDANLDRILSILRTLGLLHQVSAQQGFSQSHITSQKCKTAGCKAES